MAFTVYSALWAHVSTHQNSKGTDSGTWCWAVEVCSVLWQCYFPSCRHARAMIGNSHIDVCVRQPLTSHSFPNRVWMALLNGSVAAANFLWEIWIAVSVSLQVCNRFAAALAILGGLAAWPTVLGAEGSHWVSVGWAITGLYKPWWWPTVEAVVQMSRGHNLRLGLPLSREK